MLRALPCRRLWTPEGLRRDLSLVLGPAGRVVDVRPIRPGDGTPVAGLVVPGLVNAHTHLEWSRSVGAVPGGGGFLAWAGRLMATPPDPAAPGGEARAEELASRWGVAWVHDVSNEAVSAGWLADAGLAGVVHHEVLGRDPAQVAKARAAIGRGIRWTGRAICVRPSPHALLSTRPGLVATAVRAGSGVPATLHVGETADEERLLRTGDGPLAVWLDGLGRRWRDEPPPGVDAVSLLARLGVLGPGLMLVHGTFLRPSALRRAARAGAPLVVCARSNLHIEGALPDVPRWLAAGGRLALGTDSLASSPDLDVLAEIPVLARAFPMVPPERWLEAVTFGAMRGVLGGLGGSARWGAWRGALELDVGSAEGLRRAAPARRWRARPGQAP